MRHHKTPTTLATLLLITCLLQTNATVAATPNRPGDPAARALVAAQVTTPGAGAPTTLEVGKPVERELAGGGTHAYTLGVNA